MSVNWKENILELCQVNQISQIGGSTATQKQTTALQGDINRTDQKVEDLIVKVNSRFDGLTAKVQGNVMKEVDKIYLKITDAPDQSKLDRWRNDLTEYEKKVGKYIKDTREKTTALEANLGELERKAVEINRLLEQLKGKDIEITANLDSLKSKDTEITGLLETLKSKDVEINSKIATIETRIGTAESKQSGIEGLSGRVENIETRLNEIVSLLSKLR